MSATVATMATVETLEAQPAVFAATGAASEKAPSATVEAVEVQPEAAPLTVAPTEQVSTGDVLASTPALEAEPAAVPAAVPTAEAPVEETPATTEAVEAKPTEAVEAKPTEAVEAKPTEAVEAKPTEAVATTLPSEKSHLFTTGRAEMWDGTKDGQRAYLDPSDGSTNLNPKKIHNIKVYDIRYQEPQPTLPDNGYQIGKHPTFLTEDQFMRHSSPEGKQFIRDAYWPEVRRLVEAQLPGSKNVIPWHFSVRNQTAGYHPDEVFFMKTGVSQPAATVHVDNDHDTAIDHMRRELGEERAAELVKQHKRWAIINVWRPVGVPVQMWPLLVVDHSLIKNWNYDEHIGRVYRTNDPVYYKKHDNFLKWNDDYVFRYASALAPDEVIMFRDYDSREDSYRGCPHGGFQDDSSPANAIPRRSIEVRCFAFFDDE